MSEASPRPFSLLRGEALSSKSFPKHPKIRYGDKVDWIRTLAFKSPWESIQENLEKLPVPNAPTVLAAFQGWEDGVWHDGPLIHWGARGRLRSYIPQGLPGRLECLIDGSPAFEGQQENVAFVSYESSQARLLSLVAACRARFKPPPEEQIGFRLGDWGLSTYALMVVLRKAFPRHDLFFVGESSYKGWPPAAKRVCQNIGVNLYERSALAGSKMFEPSAITTMIGSSEIEIAEAINQRSHVIPQSLLC